ncbi:hypothetical protein NDU88_000187 [Pleurodeles waltl]|uniref:Uncharacterized protein n=1 Tax=Pleurodeles waltl TaxID=8319 RepID=A0AAV7USN7_PLEWA|nr:hypothetical protein NDU88_000187 [Pleurodeles waltl]
MAEGMDSRVLQAMKLLKETGRLDLLVKNAARRDRPVRRAASVMAAAVAACSPPRRIRVRSTPQVRRVGGGRVRGRGSVGAGGGHRQPRPKAIPNDCGSRGRPRLRMRTERDGGGRAPRGRGMRGTTGAVGALEFRLQGCSCREDILQEARYGSLGRHSATTSRAP